MNKFLKYSLYGIGGLVSLVLIAVGIFAATFNPNDYKSLIIKTVQEKKQRTLHIDGDIKLAFWPKLGADLGKISISEHKADKEFAAINGAKVSLALLPLMKKKLVIDTIYVDGASAHIVRYKDGSTNFDDLLSKDEEESEQVKFDIDGIIVTDSAVSLNDEMTGAQYSLKKFNLKTGHVALKEPFDLATDFAVTASKPTVNATANIKGNFMADPEAKHFVFKSLEAIINGDIADAKATNLSLKGNIEAKPELKEFVIDGLKLVASSTIQGAKMSADIDAPQLEVLKDKISGKQTKLIFTQDKAGQQLEANVVLADMQGSPEAFESGGIKAEIRVTQGADKILANLDLADVKGSLKAVQSSGIKGKFDVIQGKRTVQGQFSSPFAGNLEDLIFDIPKLVGNADIKDPSLPNGAAKVSFNANTHVDAKKELANVTMNANIDGSNIKGNVAVAGFKQSRIKFDLTADKLDLNKLLGSQSASKPSAPATQPPNLSALKTVLADGSINIGSILYAQYKISNLAASIKADGKAVLVSPFSAKFDDSQIKGSLGVTQFERALYTFDLDIDQLDADRYAAADTSAKPKDSKPADLSALKALNANGSLRIGNLKYGKTRASNIKIELKSDGQKLSVAPFQAKIDDSNIDASFGISRFEAPVYSFKVNIDKLDADQYITKSSAKSSDTGDTPIDLSALKTINATGAARIGWLKLANIKTSNVALDLKAEGGQVALSPFAANLYDGSMNGSLNVDARSTPSISFKQEMKSIAVGPLMVDAINNDMLEGKGTVTVDIKTQGASVNALKKALNGTASLNLADGAIKGVDIAGTIRDMKSKLNVFKDKSSVGADAKKKTDFSELTATFDIKNGVAHNEDLAMKAPILRLGKGDSRGDIDIANQKIDYLAKPSIVKSLKGQGGADLDDLAGFSIPIKITGTFAAPKYGMDFAAIGSALAKSKLLDKVGGDKGDAVGKLIGGDKAGALEGLLGGKKKEAAAETPAAPEGQAAPAPAAPAEQPQSAEDKAKEKAKKKLNKLLGL